MMLRSPNAAQRARRKRDARRVTQLARAQEPRQADPGHPAASGMRRTDAPHCHSVPDPNRCRNEHARRSTCCSPKSARAAHAKPSSRSARARSCARIATRGS
ncbi:hypothetical protein EMIT0111MI5_10095 [Burkholderia sp. IT-111MI5]